MARLYNVAVGYDNLDRIRIGAIVFFKKFCVAGVTVVIEVVSDVVPVLASRVPFVNAFVLATGGNTMAVVVVVGNQSFVSNTVENLFGMVDST